MPPVNRNQPQRARSSDSTYSVMEFMREYPDDAACLDYLWRQHYSEDGERAHCPKCDRTRKFHKVADRPAWDCDSCGYHLHPTAGTIFHKSSTSLHLWFYAIYLMSETRCGISAKHLERELGVTYKTAWRMLNLIRNNLMSDDDDSLSGDVEADETYLGGKRGQKGRTGRPGPDANKAAVLGMVERRGRVVARVVPNAKRDSLLPQIQRRVLPGSMVFTDELKSYDMLARSGYRHERIAHSSQVYVMGNVHTNTIEGFFALVKNSLKGTHHSVSRKWLQSYLDEYCFRYSNRDATRPMFRLLLGRIAAS
jgi:transposase